MEKKNTLKAAWTLILLGALLLGIFLPAQKETGAAYGTVSVATGASGTAEPIRIVELTPTPEPPTPAPTPTPTPAPTRKPLPPATPNYAFIFDVTEEELVLAARVAYLEGGVKEDSVRAVLSVIYNRCMAKRFGGKITTIKTEVFRKGQFSVVHHKRFMSIDPPKELVEYARDVFVNGNRSLPEDILFFCAARLGKGWGGRKFYKNIGGNLYFYGKTGI